MVKRKKASYVAGFRINEAAPTLREVTPVPSGAAGFNFSCSGWKSGTSLR